MTDDDVEPRVKGSLVMSTRAILVEMAGEAAVTAGLAALPGDRRAELEEMSPLVWVRASSSEMWVYEVASRLEVNPERWYDEVVRRGAERTFKTIYRVALRLVPDATLFDRLSSHFRQTRRPGTLTGVLTEPGRGEARLTGAPGMSDRSLQNIAVGSEVTLALAGRTHVKTTWTRLADGAVFTARWDR